jgi:hypothetical protein
MSSGRRIERGAQKRGAFPDSFFLNVCSSRGRVAHKSRAAALGMTRAARDITESNR